MAHFEPDERLTVDRDPADDDRDGRPLSVGARLDPGRGVKRVTGADFLAPADRALPCDLALPDRLGVERGCLDGGCRADLGELLPVRRPADRWVPAERLVRDGVRWVLRGEGRLADRLERVGLEGGPAKELAATSPRAISQTTRARVRIACRLEPMLTSWYDLPHPARIHIGLQVIAVRQ